MQQLAPRPSQPPHLIPYGLVSLWDIMLKIFADRYLKLGETMQTAREGLDAAQNVTWDHSDHQQDVFESISQMREICRRMGARSLRKVLDHKLEWYEHHQIRSSEEFDALVAMFRKELEDRVFLHVPTADAEYFQNNSLLKPKTRTAFPNLAQELRSAGNSYACGLPTACVFHCMRALEHGLNALAIDVGLKWEKEQWHTIIEQIDAQIKQLRATLPKGLAKDERLNFLSTAATEFMHFKDGWRNYVAHNRVNYEGPQALEVLEHVRTFAEKLATKLKE